MATANLLQTSVSGGTQNALSLQGDGVFFPKASTTSRLALTLTTTDKGFIVYDTTDNNIYFWNGAAWESVPSSGDAGANGSVQYNDNGIVSGATNFVWDKANDAVGIGTTSPTTYGAKLAVFGSGNGIVAVGNATSYTTLQSNGNDFYLNMKGVGSTVFRLGIGDTESMRLNPTGNLVLKGGTIAANGVGVTFPAVQVASSDANCLDDYEEGTFTPTIIGTTTAGTGTYSTQSGTYTKVGRLVSCQIFLNWTAQTGTGDMRISGLPFLVSGASNYFAAAAIGYLSNVSLSAGNIATGYAINATSVITLGQYPTGGGAGSGIAMDTSGEILISVTYIV